MFNIGFGEMILIAGIALVVIGPEKFPEFAKIVIRAIRDLRGYVDDVKTELHKELQPVKKELDDLSRYKPEDYIDALANGSDEDEEPAEDGQESSAADESKDSDSGAAAPAAEPAAGEQAASAEAQPTTSDTGAGPERLDG